MRSVTVAAMLPMGGHAGVPARERARIAGRRDPAGRGCQEMKRLQVGPEITRRSGRCAAWLLPPLLAACVPIPSTQAPAESQPTTDELVRQVPSSFDLRRSKTGALVIQSWKEKFEASSDGNSLPPEFAELRALAEKDLLRDYAASRQALEKHRDQPSAATSLDSLDILFKTHLAVLQSFRDPQKLRAIPTDQGQGRVER